MFGIWTARACPSLRRLCGGSAASAAVVDDSFKSRGVLGSLPTNRTAGCSGLSSAAIPACNHLQRFLHAIPQLSHAWVQDLTRKSVVRVNPRVVRVNPSIVRVNPSIVRVNPSNSQLRSLCHGLLYYGGHAVVTWRKGCTSLSGWSRNDFVAETPDPRTQMYR